MSYINKNEIKLAILKETRNILIKILISNELDKQVENQFSTVVVGKPKVKQLVRKPY